MNVATIVGVVIGVVILGWAIVSATGEVRIFWYPQGIAIVLGGVVAATFICYPLREVLRLFESIAKVFRREDLPVAAYVSEIAYLAQQAIAGNPMRLERELQGTGNQFLKDALRMTLDQYPEEKLRAVLGAAIDNTHRRELAEAEILRTMARLSPAFGMVGTLIGLIVMFKNMGGEIALIGAGMATAMMTTFYGLLLAYLVFLPMSVKLQRRAEERVVLMTVITEGMILVARRTPPAMVLDQLRAYLPPAKWKDVELRGPARPAG